MRPRLEEAGMGPSRPGRTQGWSQTGGALEAALKIAYQGPEPDAFAKQLKDLVEETYKPRQVEQLRPAPKQSGEDVELDALMDENPAWKALDKGVQEGVYKAFGKAAEKARSSPYNHSQFEAGYGERLLLAYGLGLHR